jgi:hypothetical protein
LLIIILIWYQKARDLSALRWGMIWFLAGEIACAIDFLFFGGTSPLFEYLHSYGMIVGFSFVVFALLEGLDERLIQFSSKTNRCAALGLCGACAKYSETHCGLKRMFHLIIPAFLVLAAMPLCASFKSISYNANILGTAYTYSHPVLYQAYEFRYCAYQAIVLFLISWMALTFKAQNTVFWSKCFFAAGLGSFGFGFLRLVIFTAYTDNLLWFEAWEEITELIFVCGVLFTLGIFRHSLFKKPKDGVVETAK